MKMKLVNTHTGFNLGVELMNTYEDYAAGNGENINELELFPAYRPDELKTIAANLYDGGWRAEDSVLESTQRIPQSRQTYTVTGTFAYYCKDIKNGGYYVRFEPDNVNLYEYYVDKPQNAAKKARTALRMIIT